MTFAEMETFVRLHADADTNDAPDTTLTVYARLAYNDILSRRGSWPHLSVRYSLTTVIGTSEYPFTAFNITDMERVTAVTASTNLGWRVQYITLTDAMLLFTPTSPSGNQAQGYTIIGSSTLKLFPTPSSVQTYTIDGFRTPTAWPGAAGSSPDLPRVFDEAICWFMLAKYYTSQEDQQLAAFYMSEYERTVDRFVKSETLKRVQPRPSVIGPNNRSRQSNFMDRVRGSLE